MDKTNLRGNSTVNDMNKPQDSLHAMKVKRITPLPQWPEEVPLNESHLNLMQSWLNLRGMDNKLAQERQKSKSK